MILGRVSFLDCCCFLLLLAPQLIWYIGFFRTLYYGIKGLPFLVIKLPISLLYERLVVCKSRQSPFVQQATWFEDVVVRCVRYAFAYIPAAVGRVFFSKWVALPFWRFRMLRHGYLQIPIHWHEVKEDNFKGIWLTEDNDKRPDVVIYYIHGGGFSMGSGYFYLEFLASLLTMLKSSGGFQNPAIFALEYTLVPDKSYPTQPQEALAGYKYVLARAQAPSKICVSGDSAGANLVLSLLLHLSKRGDGTGNGGPVRGMEMPVPQLAVLISPWVNLSAKGDQNTASDYLDVASLHLYAGQYTGGRFALDDPLISPGACKDLDWWRRASPTKGLAVLYGAEEVFAPQIRDLLGVLREADVLVEAQQAKGGIHAWPIAALFLSSTASERQKGLKTMVTWISTNMRD